ncbi:BRO family protein [Maridesulfovibrio sp.]|uniref:BRO-N domain-containing protein n=1 Tax=Maridesulfovibrio sp. TaxID=2795000 RepID=UPI0029F4B6CF|nr:BRO family protein [Maridesulfovibrio sp.]
MSEVIPFDFGESVVRVHQGGDGNPWFVAKDVGNVLEIQNIRQNLESLEDDEKGVCNIYTPGGNQEVSAISESGLYALIFKSRKPEAKKFRKWITSEVIPSLRKTGCYAMGQGADQSALPSLDEYDSLYDLLSKWGVLLKEKEDWKEHEVLDKSICKIMVFLGKDPNSALKDLSKAEADHVQRYLTTQLTIMQGDSGKIISPEEQEAARLRSEKAKKAARARWDKAKAIEK